MSLGLSRPLRGKIDSHGNAFALQNRLNDNPFIRAIGQMHLQKSRHPEDRQSRIRIGQRRFQMGVQSLIYIQRRPMRRMTGKSSGSQIGQVVQPIGQFTAFVFPVIRLKSRRGFVRKNIFAKIVKRKMSGPGRIRPSFKSVFDVSNQIVRFEYPDVRLAGRRFYGEPLGTRLHSLHFESGPILIIGFFQIRFCEFEQRSIQRSRQNRIDLIAKRIDDRRIERIMPRHVFNQKLGRTELQTVLAFSTVMSQHLFHFSAVRPRASESPFQSGSVFRTRANEE